MRRSRGERKMGSEIEVRDQGEREERLSSEWEIIAEKDG